MRRLTPVEAALLQRFPESVFSNVAIDEKLLYKQLGNAVPVGLVQFCANWLIHEQNGKQKYPPAPEFNNVQHSQQRIWERLRISKATFDIPTTGFRSPVTDTGKLMRNRKESNSTFGRERTSSLERI